MGPSAGENAHETDQESRYCSLIDFDADDPDLPLNWSFSRKIRGYLDGGHPELDRDNC